MDLLGDKPELDLSDESWRIFARHSASAPQFVGARAQVENSYITEGCEIYGTVKNSVVGPGVRVMHGAVVEDSVLMGDATVQPGAVIRYTILDTGVTVGAGATVGADRASGAAITVVGEDVTIEYMSEATEVLAAMQASSGYPVAMLPQPYVTTAQMQMEGLKVALDMTEEWDKVSPDSALVTGVVVARKEFVEQNEAAFNEFLEDYKASTEFVNANVDEAAALVAGYEIVPKEPIAQKALPECNITFISGADMKAKVSGYLKVLYDQNPEAVGGTLPDDAFYYGA